MPKENTHLNFAYGLLGDFHRQAILKDISENIWHYLLGSIIPDTFYYGSSSKYRRISESFHGKDGNPTNTTIIEVIENSHSNKDLAFILGYISHCALDITFHPIIYYLSGNYYDETPEKRNHAVYLHRHLETCLDMDIRNTIRFHRLIRTHTLRGLVFEGIISEKYQVPIYGLRHSLRRQLGYNFLFTRNWAYVLARAAAKSGIFTDTSQLGLFYGDADNGERIPSVIQAVDLVDGRPRTTSVSELFSDARSLAKDMMGAAYGYWTKSISCNDLLMAIPGLSLDTGKLGISASGIHYTRWENPQERA